MKSPLNNTPLLPYAKERSQFTLMDDTFMSPYFRDKESAQVDILGYSLPIYHIERIIKEKGAPFGDKSEIIYVDAKNRSNTRLGRLMHDMHCKNYTDMFNPILAKNMYYWKETEEGQCKMCKIMDDLLKRESAKAANQAAYENSIATAKKLLHRGRYSYAEIAEDTTLPLDKVLELAEQQSA